MEWFEDIVAFANPENGNLFQRLVDCGAIHPKDIVYPNGEVRHLDRVLDYAMCSEEHARQYKAWLLERGEQTFDAEVGGFVRTDLSPERIEELMVMPVGVGQDGTGAVHWYCNRIDETPGIMIAAKFPDEIFTFREMYGHRVTSAYHFNNDGPCTSDGRHLDAWLTTVKGKQVKSQDENTAKINIPFNNTDRYFAKIYLPKYCVVPHDYKEGNEITPEKYFDIYVEDMNKNIPVYRTLENGEFKKDYYTWAQLREILKSTKEEWRSNNLGQNRHPVAPEVTIPPRNRDTQEDNMDDEFSELLEDIEV